MAAGVGMAAEPVGTWKDAPTPLHRRAPALPFLCGLLAGEAARGDASPDRHVTVDCDPGRASVCVWCSGGVAVNQEGLIQPNLYRKHWAHES